MKGKWNGEYWFTEKAPAELMNRKTKFEINIDSYKNSKFSGWVEDDLETGGTRGKGIIKGSIKKDRVQFTKQMPIRTNISQNGEKTEEQKPHRKLFYTGILDSNNNLIKGTWRFKKGFGLLKDGIIIHLGAKGEWKMKKVD